MTAPSLKGNFSKFGAYFTYKLRSLRTLTILNSIFALLSYPLMMAAAVPYSYTEAEMRKLREIPNYNKLPRFYELKNKFTSLESLFIASLIIGFIMLAALFLMNYVFVSKSFRWLYNKSVVDMDYSLPVSDDTRFFGDLLASLTGSLVPHLLAIAIGGGLYWLMPFEAWEMGDSMAGEMFRVGMQLAFTGVFACVMFMGTCLLVISMCGRVVEARIMPFVANAVVPAIHLVCVIMLIQGIYGYGYNSTYEYTSVAATSPLGLLFMTIYTMMDAMTLESYRVIMLNPDVLTALLVVTIACFAGAYALIRFRRTERVGNPYVYSVGKYIMPSAVVFAIVSLFMVATLPEGGEFEFIDRSELVGPYMAMLIITFVVYVIMELISGKGFGKFYNTMLRYVVTMAVSVVVCLAIYAANGMGLANLVPDVDKVNTAVFTVSGDYGSDDFSLNRVTVDSPEMIEKVAEIHRSIPKYDHAKDDPYRFEVMYTLDSGSVIEREYFITRDEYAAAMQQLLTPEVFYTSQTINRVWNTERYTVTVESISSESGMDVINMPIEKLLDALYEDSRLVSYDLISDPEKTCAEYYLKVNRVDNVGQSGDNYWSYAGTYMESIQIWPWQQNTIKLLESYGANNALQTGNSVYILRVPAESIYSYKDNEMFAEKLYLNVYREDRLDGTQEYSGDFSYSVKGSSEMLPGGLYCMADAKTQHLDLIYAANRDKIEDLYHYDQIYMMIYADMSKADKEGTFCIDLNDSVKFVGMDEYNTAEWIFEYLYY